MLPGENLFNCGMQICEVPFTPRHCDITVQTLSKSFVNRQVNAADGPMPTRKTSRKRAHES